jgi:hypothetical protein
MAKMRNQGKNRQVHYCGCGGQVSMVVQVKNGKMRNVARCAECRCEARKPSDLQYVH